MSTLFPGSSERYDGPELLRQKKIKNNDLEFWEQTEKSAVPFYFLFATMGQAEEQGTLLLHWTTTPGAQNLAINSV